MTKYQMFIGGAWVEASGGDRFDSANPYSGENWASFPRATPADVDAAVTAAHETFVSPAWQKMTPSARGALMRKLADMLPSLAPDFGALETRDNGKLINDTRNEALYLAGVFHYWAGMADKVEGIVTPNERPGIMTFSRYQPIGVVAVITPWNSPLLIAGMKIATALAAGCTIVVKPSEFTSASTLEFARLFARAGFPDGVINVVTGFGGEVGEALVTHPKIAKITFTGGTETGRRINMLAAGSLKKTVLELGGKSANIVFDDADIEQAVKGAILGVFTSSGQTCIAGSRLLLHQKIHDRFLERLVERVRGLRLGDPFDPATQIGPISTRPQYEKILGHIESAKREGAVCALGGEALPGKGQLIRPTIFSDVDNSMDIAQQEVFGPVLSVIRFHDEDEAVEIANGTDFGLAGAAWTADIGRAFRMVERIEAGTIWINMYRMSSYMAPFTGYKQSGLGSENGQANLLHFMKAKTAYINHGGDVTVPFLDG